MIFRILIAAITFHVLPAVIAEIVEPQELDETVLEKLLTATLAKSADHFCAILALLCVCVGILSVSVYKFIKTKCCIEEDKHCLEMVNIISK